MGFLHTSILVTLFICTGSQFQTWRRIHEVTLDQDLSLQKTHQAQERLATPPGSTSPTLFKQWCGFFLSPTRTRYVKVLSDGWNLYGFSSLSKKTRKSIHLQMSLHKRQQFLLSYLKTLSVGPAKVWIGDLPSADQSSPKWANQVVIKCKLSVNISTECLPTYRSICQLSASHMLVVKFWSSVHHVLTEVSTKCCHGNFVISQENL